MATQVSITKVMEERLRRMAADPPPPGTFSATTARQLLALIEDRRQRKALTTALKPMEAVQIVRGILGSAAIVPVKLGPLLGYVTRRINFLGLTADDVERAARRVKRTWKLPTSVHYIFVRMEELTRRDPPALGLVVEAPNDSSPEVRIGRGNDEW